MDVTAVRATGKHVDLLVKGLIQGADDKNKEVQVSISDAMLRISHKHVDLVISSCLNYLTVNMKQLSQNHRIAILEVMERVVRELLDQIEEKLANELVKHATLEMIASKDVIPEWQTAAMNLLVAAGEKYIESVMAELNNHFQPGVLPHFFVVQTLGKLATANPYGMVAFINVVLGTMLPMLGMAKQDNLRWVFSYTLSKFAEAIVFYVENMDQAPDKNVKKEIFANEFYSAYDVLFNVWLPQAKTAQLRTAVILAIGGMCYIIDPSQLSNQQPKLIPTILSLYKKHTEQLAVTECLCMVLDASTKDNGVTLDPLLETIINQLFQMVCLPVDPAHAQQIKNQNEILRCFTVLNRVHSDKLVASLLQKLEPAQEKTRIGALIILKHLINSAGPHMEVKKALIISGLRILLHEPNNKVKKVFAQTIISMAHHGYLELESGEDMVEFIVRQCTLKEETRRESSADPDHVTNSALRHMCESVFQLITNTIDIMEKVLWPYLMELIIPVQYTEAIGPICKNLAALAGKKRAANDADYLVDYEDEANLPSPESLIVRLIVLAGVPQNGRRRGMHVLNTMLALVPNLNQTFASIWDDVIPKLIRKLEEFEEEDQFKQKKWEDLILKLLSTSLNAVGEEQYITDLGQLFGEQIQLYKEYPEEKGFCFKCLGVVLRRSSKKEFLQAHVDIMFQQVNHSDKMEQEGLAMGLGFAAASHFDPILVKLEQYGKGKSEAKKTGIIGFIKDKVGSDNHDVTPVKLTVLLSYGYVTLYAPVSLVTSRIEAVIMRQITPYFTHIKEASIKSNAISTIELIAKALEPTHLQQKHEFSQRPQLITYLLTCVKHEPTDRINGRIRCAVFDACAALVKLDPVMSEADVYELVKTCLDSLCPLPSNGVKKGKSESYEEQLEQERLMDATLASLNKLLQELLVKSFSPSGFNSVFQHLVPWIVKAEDHMRERAVAITLNLLQFYLSNMSPNDQAGSEFSVLGVTIARLVPRCTDPTIRTRDDAIIAIQTALRIQLIYGGVATNTPDKMVDALPVLKERLQKSDSQVLFSAVNDLAKVLAKKTPMSKQLTELVFTLIEGLSDAEPLCSNGACVVLNGLMKLRGSELKEQVPEIIARLSSSMPYIQFEQTRTGALRCVRALAIHHLEDVTTVLLTYPIPYHTTLVDFWQVLSKEAVLTEKVVRQFIELLNQNMPYEEKAGSDKKHTGRVATTVPLSIILALQHMLSVPEAKEIASHYYSQIFCLLLLKCGCYVNCKPPIMEKSEGVPKSHTKETKADSKKDQKTKTASSVMSQISPSRVAVDTLKALLSLADKQEVVDKLDEQSVWDKLTQEEELITGIEHLAKSMAEYSADRVEDVVNYFKLYLNSLYDPERVVITAFYSQMISSRCGENTELIESLIGYQMARLVDQCISVRMLAVRGLGNISHTGAELVQKYSTSVLSSMISGMDDRDDIEDIVTQEAMTGLSKVLHYINESHVRPILINIALKIRPCFEKDKASLRCAAFELFGHLSKFGNGPSKGPFLEQIESNLTAILLHLNDKDESVKLACKKTLRQIGPLLNSEKLNTMFQKYLIDNGHLHYGEFMNDLSKVIVMDFKPQIQTFVMGCVTYFKSHWPEIRANASLYIGCLMNALPESSQGMINQDHISNALLQLLKDTDYTVRCKAAEAISLLSNSFYQ